MSTPRPAVDLSPAETYADNARSLVNRAVRAIEGYPGIGGNRNDQQKRDDTARAQAFAAMAQSEATLALQATLIDLFGAAGPDPLGEAVRERMRREAEADERARRARQ